MNRRLFLGSFPALAAIVADPERLLWTPTKKIFIPPLRVFEEKMYGVDIGFAIGDIITFDSDPLRYVVTDIHPPTGGFSFKPLDDGIYTFRPVINGHNL